MRNVVIPDKPLILSYLISLDPWADYDDVDIILVLQSLKEGDFFSQPAVSVNVATGVSFILWCVV